MTTASTTVRQALRNYFDESGFDESSYSDDWVDIPLGPIPFRFPNTESRKQIMPLHDMHHALTGYKSTFMGELQIGAFEVGGGIGRHWIGWVLNLLSMSWGAFVFPRTSFRAFVRGRRSTNFYQRGPESDLLDRDIDEVRAERGIQDAPAARIGDYPAFVGWSFVALLVGLIGVALMPVMAAGGLWGLVKARREAADAEAAGIEVADIEVADSEQ